MDILLYIIIGLGIVFIAAGLAIANFSGNQLYDYYKKLFNEVADVNKTAFEFCNLVSYVESNGVLKVKENDKIFGGAYLPSRCCIELSTEVFYSASVSALTITAHEIGHFIQNKRFPKVLTKNSKFIKIINLLGKLIFPIFLASIVALILNYFILTIILISTCFIFFILALSLKISTIKIEKQASKFAVEILEKYEVMDSNQLIKAKKLLKYAAMTYTADFFSALLFWTFLTKKTKIFWN